MTELNDHELLAEFARSGSEAAFAELVARHVNLVYSAALRFCGDAQHCEEITQAVFIILARKAGKLSPRVVLSGWLYQTARLTAANLVKGEIRRQRREQEAYMQSTLNETDAAAWQQLAPLLDEAMGRLGETDRNAVVLRFFENKTAAEVAAALKITEAAAHKRVNRALEKLRKIFGKRGVALSATLIAGTVAANSVQAAPVGLAATVTAAANGASISATITTLVKGTMKTMTWLKLKFAIGVGVAALLAGGVATVAVSQTGGSDKLTVPEIAKQTQEAYAALTSYSDTAKGVSEGGGQTTETTCTTRLQRPKQYRVEWTTTGGLYVSKGLVWSDGGANYEVMDAADKFAAAKAQTMNDRQTAFAMALGASGGAASTVPGAFFELNFGDKLGAFASGRTEMKREADEKIAGMDCYVVVSVLDGDKLLGNGKMPKNAMVDLKSLGTTTTTLWIGKKDHLIRKSKTTTAGMSVAMKFTDEALKVALERQKKPVTPENLAALRAEMENSMAQLKNSGFVFIETHENIVVNQKFSAADFAR